MSLYEVSEVKPGSSFLARDLIRGGEPILVSEKSATQTLKAWDRIAARIVPIREKHILTGGLLPYTMEAADNLIDGLCKAEGKRSRRAKLAIDDETLKGLAHLFTTAWLFEVLPQAMGRDDPNLHNSDGDEVVFHKVRFPLMAKATLKAVASKLDAMTDLQKENAGFWNWLGGRSAGRPLGDGPPNALHWNVTIEDGSVVLGNIELKDRAVLFLSGESDPHGRRVHARCDDRSAKGKRRLLELAGRPERRGSPQGDGPPNALHWNYVTMEDGTVVLGNIELKDRAVMLSVNSAARAAQGAQMLQGELADLVRAPSTEIQTIDQIRKSTAQAPPDRGDPARSRHRLGPRHARQTIPGGARRVRAHARRSKSPPWPHALQPAAKSSSLGSSSWRTVRATRPTPPIRWRPMISAWLWRELGSRTCGADCYRISVSPTTMH